MSSFNNNPYTYIPGTNRLLDPSYTPSRVGEDYVFEASSALVQDAIAFSVSNPTSLFQDYNGLYYNLEKPQNSGSAPQNPPSVPQAISQPTTTSITVVFNISGVGGDPLPNFSVKYGTGGPLVSLNATRAAPELALYVATATNLTPGTTYYFQSVARNSEGTTSSIFVPIETATSGGGTAPSAAPTIPELVGKPSASSITVSFDVAGITGTPPPTYNALIGTPTQPGAPVVATLVSGTTYSAVASGLSPNTTYFFRSEASNGVSPNAISDVSAGITTDGTPSVMANLLVMTFLVYNGTDWLVSTGSNAACGSIILSGPDAGTIVSDPGGPGQTASIANIISWAGTSPIIVSFGGATLNLVQALPDEATARGFVNSFWNQFIASDGAANPLDWEITAEIRGAFSGLDLDFEGAVVDGAIIQALVDQWRVNCYAFSEQLGFTPVLTFTPQTPNTWLDQPSSQAWTNGNANIPFAWAGAALSTLAADFNDSDALLARYQLSIANYVFAQIYNQPAQYLTSPPDYTVYNPVFTTQMAQWAYLIMLARRRNNAPTKLIWAFSSSTAGVTTPVWTTANQAQLNAAIELINPLVSAQLVADGLGACIATEWSGGIGFWTSPTGNTAAQAAFSFQSAISKDNMAGDATMLWMEAATPSPDPAWSGPVVPIKDNRGPGLNMFKKKLGVL